MTAGHHIVVLAQAVPPDWLGGAGWVGAGLLGVVLYWLLWHHLPAKDAQISGIHKDWAVDRATKDAQITVLVTAKDAQITALVATCTAQRREDLAAYREEIRQEREDCAIAREADKQMWTQDRLALVARLEAQHKDTVAHLKQLDDALDEIRHPQRRRPDRDVPKAPGGP